MNHIVKENLYITNQISMDLAIILVLLSEAGQNIAVFGKVQIPSAMVRIPSYARETHIKFENRIL